MAQITTKPTTALDLLETILSHPTPQRTKLIICTSRNSFLHQLQNCLLQLQQQQQQQQQPQPPPPPPAAAGTPPTEIPPTSSSSQDPPRNDNNTSTPPPSATKHAILTPTLTQLSRTQNVNVAFCASINTLRAYVSTFPADADQVVIADMLALHVGTSEFTVQGLSRTFAGVASMLAGRSVRLVECVDVVDPGDPGRGSGLWDAEVPLLSASVRIGGDGVGWAGRTVRVRRVVERWFVFED